MKQTEKQSETKPKRIKKIDVVCGMELENLTDIVKISHKGKSFYFCGNFCKNRFQKNPGRFQKTPLIKLKNVWKIFQMGGLEVKVLRDLSLNVWEGDFVAILGSSGSGKSTTLNVIGLLDRPTSGEFFLNGKDVSLLGDDERAQLRSKFFGFVFQQYNLIPWLTAYENASLPLVFAGKDIKEKKIKEAFEDIGLEKRMTHRPFELSGGEQQRVATLRALANDPKIILGDEPTGNLDSETGDKLLKLLINLNKVQKKTLIVVTHDAGIAEKADQLVVLKDGHSLRDHQIQKKKYTE